MVIHCIYANKPKGIEVKFAKDNNYNQINISDIKDTLFVQSNQSVNF
jgi:hypothetical protein